MMSLSLGIDMMISFSCLSKEVSCFVYLCILTPPNPQRGGVVTVLNVLQPGCSCVFHRDTYEGGSVVQLLSDTPWDRTLYP